MIDAATGLAQLLGPIAGGGFDVRGAEERIGTGDQFGMGCDATNGNPVQLGITLQPEVGQAFRTDSSTQMPTCSHTALLQPSKTTPATV